MPLMRQATRKRLREAVCFAQHYPQIGDKIALPDALSSEAWRLTSLASCPRKEKRVSASANPVFDALLARRSGKAPLLAAPAPDSQALEKIILAASRAPDHGRLVPFRFLEVTEDARGTLGDLMEASARELNPAIDAVELERAREKADQGAMILAMIAKIDTDHPKITSSDQWLSAGCALENLLLAAQSFGFGAAVRSGSFLETKAVRTGFALAENEHLTCLIVLGTPKDWPPAKPKPTLEQVFSRWNG